MGTHDSIPRQRAYEDSDRWVQEFRLTLDQMAEGALVIGAAPMAPPGPQVLYVNQGLLAMTGWSMDDLQDQPLGNLFEPAALADFLLRLPVVGETGRRFHVDVPIRKANGHIEVFRWFLRAGLKEDGEVRRYLVSMRRIERAAAPVAVQAPSSEAELRSGRMEALAQVAGGVAHDFNNVLAAVLTSVSLAIDEEDAAVRTGLLEDARASCDAARTLVRRLLSYARGVGGGNTETIDPVHVMREAIRLASFGANVRCNLQNTHAPGSVKADPVQLMQVLHNLLINARQAMPGGGTVEVEVRQRDVEKGEIPDIQPGSYVEWVVRDRGCGIPPESLERIFDPFFTTKREGTGLGLSTSLRIAREHGGTIRVTSRPNTGSEFRVYLPRVETVPESTSSALAAAPDAAISPVRGTGLVIVADDQDPVRDAMRRQLEHLGYTVATAATATSAVALYRRFYLDGKVPLAVVMDLTFPGGMTGTEAAAEITALDPNAFVAACSGFLTGGHESVPDAAFAACLPKPFTMAELARVLQQAGARHKDRGSSFAVA